MRDALTQRRGGGFFTLLTLGNGMSHSHLFPLLILAAPLPLLAANPIITDRFTADPAALVHDGTVYLYTGHDEAPPDQSGYVMKEWLCFSSTNMVDWKAEGSPLSLEDFSWAEANAWASHAIERDGRFYWYVSVWRGEGNGFAVGVAVADSPTGPFTDALGGPLISSEMTPDPINPEGVRVTWDDIDPAVFIDDDGQAYIFWGNTNLYWAKLKANMIELDGEIQQITLPKFVEAPWLHKHGDLYYLTYAYGFPERIAYATATDITGPWEFRSVIKQLAGNSNTNHPAIINFKGRSYFIYHNGGLLTGGSFRRSVCIDYLYYNADGTIREIIPTMEGVVSSDEPLPSAMGEAEDLTWVFVHGAWAGGWEWKEVGDAFLDRGDRVYRPTHTGQGERRHLANDQIDVNTHIRDVVNVLEWEGLEDVILVGHSYGGMVVTGVADTVPARIRKVIYLDAALPEDGESFYGTFGGSRPPLPAEDGFTFPGDYDRSRPVPHIVPQSEKTFATPVSLGRQDIARKLPTAYILTADDKDAPEADGFYRSYERAKNRGWEVGIMEADHVPHLNQVDALVELLDKVARSDR